MQKILISYKFLALIDRPTLLNSYIEDDVFKYIFNPNMSLSLGLDQEGIYRVSGIKSKIEELKYMYDHGKTLSILNWYKRLGTNKQLLSRIL